MKRLCALLRSLTCPPQRTMADGWEQTPQAMRERDDDLDPPAGRQP